MSLRAVLFDLTGTLIEPADAVGSVYQRFASRHGAEIPASRLDDAFGRVMKRMPPRVFPGLTPDEIAAHEQSWWREAVRQTYKAADSTIHFDDFDALFEDLFAYFAHAAAWRLFPLAVPCLTGIRTNGIQTGLVSNFDHRLPDLLESIGIKEL